MNTQTNAAMEGAPLSTTPDGEPSVGKQLLRSISSLGLRQIIVQGLGAATGIVLARKLDPVEFGVYALSGFFYYLFLSVGDLGLGASLVRDPREPGVRSYQLAFTVRQIFDLTIFGVVWFAAPQLAHSYGLSADHVWVFRAVSAAAFASSFQLVPNVRLERTLSFERIALIETLQAAAFTITILVLAFLGKGSMSFGAAWLAFSVTGVLAANLWSPWQIGWSWDAAELRARLPFALPYQGVGLLYLGRDAVNPILIGMLLGAQQVGFVNWAQMLATFSVLVLNVLQRVYLPAFARLQHDRTALGALFEKVLSLGTLLNGWFAVLLLVLAQPITELIFGAKWLPALPLFYCFWLANIAAPATVPTLSLLNALGRSFTAFRFTLCCALGIWALSVPLVFLNGPVGLGIAYALVQLGSLVIVRFISAELKVRFWQAMSSGWIGIALSIPAGLLIVGKFPVDSLPRLILSAGILSLIYAAAALFGAALCGRAASSE